VARESPAIPNSMRKVSRRFEHWRSAHTGRLPIPKGLWCAAVELARQHGVFPTAKALRLEYGKLKQSVEATGPVARSRVAKAPAAAPRRARSTAPPAFVGTADVPSAGLAECRIELEGRRGQMRIHWKGTTAPDLGGLSRALWESK
jgi:hypothetical protein